MPSSDIFSPGFFSDVLERSGQPIREFMAGMQASTPPTPKYAGLPEGEQQNPFIRMLLPGRDPLAPGVEYFSPTGAGLFSDVMANMPIAPGGMARWRATQAPPNTPEAPSLDDAQLGPIARAHKQQAQAAAGAGSVDGIEHATRYAPLFDQIGKEEGVPPDVLMALAATERSAPNAVSPQGARGLMQVVPGQGFDLPGEDWTDPATSIRQGARALKAKYAATGDWNAAAGAYFGYGTDATGTSTNQYLATFQQNLQAIRSRQVQTSTEATPQLPTPPPGTRPLQGITPAQYGSEGLATGAADYICGVVAASAFVQTQGRNPTLREALDLARGQGLIDSTNGMHGIGATVQLIKSLGGQARAGAVNQQQMAAEIAAGRPVIIDTDAGSRGHYFVAENYDPASGRFDFGNSARALKASGGRTWYTLGEIASLGFGAPHGAIYAS